MFAPAGGFNCLICFSIFGIPVVVGIASTLGKCFSYCFSIHYIRKLDLKKSNEYSVQACLNALL